MSTPEEIKDQQKSQWNAAAGGWHAWAAWYAANFQPLPDWLCRAAGVRPGSRVLDIGCGTGGPALAAAAQVHPAGRVVAIDLSPEMLAAAAQRAGEARLETIEFHEMDAEHLRFEDRSFDSVTCACGLMFCPDIRQAVAEIHRVLEPGGRFAVAVWDDPSKNPFFTTIGQAFARFFPAPPPDPSARGPFRLAPPGQLEAVLRAGGFSDFALESRPMPIDCGSVAQYWRIFLAFAPALGAKLSTLSPPELGRLQESVAEAAGPYLEDGSLRLTATPLCASGQK